MDQSSEREIKVLLMQLLSEQQAQNEEVLLLAFKKWYKSSMHIHSNMEMTDKKI